MSTISACCWLVTLGFWAGYSFRVWGEHRAERAAKLVSPSAEAQLGRSLIEIARSLKTTRKLVGSGVSITNTSTWTVRDAGTFTITVEEATEETV